MIIVEVVQGQRIEAALHTRAKIREALQVQVQVQAWEAMAQRSPEAMPQGWEAKVRAMREQLSWLNVPMPPVQWRDGTITH